MILAAEVQRVLSILGPTYPDVAQTLAAKGIRGTHQVASCPISLYLAEQFPGARVFTNAFDVQLDDGNGRVSVVLPFPVRALVTHFDGGDHPELES